MEDTDMSTKLIDLGYTDYEIDKIMQRLESRCKREGLTLTELGSIYRETGINTGYPFYYWALKYFEMYTWMPNLVSSKEEDMKLLEEYKEYMPTLSTTQRINLDDEFKKYRDEAHENGDFIIPFYIYVLTVHKGKIKYEEEEYY